MKVGHKSWDILIDAILVIAHVVNLYQSFPNESGLEAIKEALDKRKRC